MSSGEHILRSLIRIVAILLAGVLLFIIGYGAMGGGNPFKVLLPDVWRHILDFVH